ncbi:MAG TPA: transglycosylase SLT domain-containing protein [Anaeromyxobacter sp.]
MPHALLAVLLAAAPLTAADLTPLLADGSAGDGKAAFDAGRYADAAQKLARSPLPGAAFLRAIALVRERRPEEALRAAEGLEAKLPEIGDRIACLRAEALEEVGRPRDALAAWAGVPDGSLRGAEARLARARLAASLGDPDGALGHLAPLLALPRPADASRPDFAATALLLAGRLSAAKDPAAARRTLLDCWSGHPLAPEALECRSALSKLPEPHGAAPASEDVLRRAEALLDANRNGAALELLRPLLEDLPAAAPGEPFACRARAAAGRALRKERSYENAITTLRPVAGACADPEVRVRSLYLLASAASIAGDRDESVRLYRRLARDFPDHPFADDALFYAADLLARLGRTDEARDALGALVRDHPTGDFRDEARFRIAWLARRAGDVDAAVAQLLALEEERRDDPYEHARAAYWRARFLAGRGEEGRAAARAIWADLVQRYPADYYGLLARARLAGGALGAPALPAPVLLPKAVAEAELTWEPGALREDPRFRAGVLLLRLGLFREAADELGAIDPRRLRAAAADSPDAVLLVADLLDRAGDHRAAHGLLRTRARAAFRRPPDGENIRAWKIAYPPAYREDVRRWAAPAGVPIDLVQALMREESALDPRALSPAGAIGLTQLMLPTAQSVARQLRLGKVSRASLTDASLNIRLGSRYLGELVRRFDGSIALALAAYNAGGGAVSRWLDQRRGLELDEFVEEIPVEETRGYVKRVLRSYAAYRLLYGQPGESPSPNVKLAREH